MPAEEKKRPIRRLKTMYPLRAKVNEAYLKTMEATRAGKPTAWAMYNGFVADPIMKAMDIDVVYPENYGAVVAALGPCKEYLDAADAEGFPSHTCGYSRVGIGYTARMMKDLEGEIPPEAPMGGMPKPLFLLARSMGCDVGVKWFQSLGRYFDVPVWCLEFPLPGVKEFFMEGVFDRVVKLQMEHIGAFIAFLERLLGRKLDWDKFGRIVDTTIEIMRVWYEVNELRKAKPCPMHSRDFWSVFPAFGMLLGDIDDTLEKVRDMYQEVKGLADNHVSSVVPGEKYRLVFAELPPWHSLKFFDTLAERGWNFPVETFGYHPPEPADLSIYHDPLERLVRFTLQFTLGYYKRAFEENVPNLIGYPYLTFAREWKCDGVWLHPLLTCRSASLNLTYIASILMERLQVPSLMLEGDIVDLTLFDPEDALRRAEPFEETMEHYRKVRKKEGFDW